MDRFKVIKNDNPKPLSGMPDDWHCRECLRRDGFSTRDCIEIFMPSIKGNKINKGKKTLICLNCKMKGVTTYVT